ncbi:MAG: SDH family Clp fold serine proteinase [Gemmobacter sp.]
MVTFVERRKLYKKIEAARSSKVLLFATGDRPGMEAQIAPDCIDFFVDHLDSMWPAKKISLVLHTRGGDTAAAWQLVNLLRTFCDDLEVIVPSKALSAGTLISLGANRILMTKQASLGPIDPSLNGPLNPLVPGGGPNHRAPVSVEAVQGFLDVVTEQLKVTDASALATVWNNLAEKIHPLVLGQIFRSRSQIRTLAKRLLAYQNVEEEKREAIISFLCSDSGSHDHTINRREATAMGLAVEKPSDELYTILKALHDNVSAAMKFRTPFSPDTELAGKDQERYSCFRVLIESVAHGSHAYVSEGEITKMQVLAPNGIPQIAIQDARNFEGWKKVA